MREDDGIVIEVCSSARSSTLTHSTTGACLEYFLRHDILAQLERLCERDRPRGVKGE